MRLQTLVTTSAGLALLAAGAAVASPPTHNSLGATFKVVSKGAISTIEIRLSPKAAFDSVRVEAASGIGSLSPACAFSDVVAGGAYSCQVNVSAAEGAGSLTLNVVGERTVDPQRPRVVEVGHFTLATDGAVAAPKLKRSAKSAVRPTSDALLTPDKPAPGAILTPPGAAPK